MYNVNPDCKELISKGICKADCCGVVPFSKRSWLQIKHVIDKDKKYEIKEFKNNGEIFVLAITNDFKCVFLDDKCKCKIYTSPRRPNLCMLFGKINNNPLMACPHINPECKALTQVIREELNNIRFEK